MGSGFSGNVNGGNNWQSAQDWCVASGYNLVTINDDIEESWLVNEYYSQPHQQTDAWIGLNDIDADGSFTWIADDSPLGYDNTSSALYSGECHPHGHRLVGTGLQRR